jgi:hypothetical protein
VENQRLGGLALYCGGGCHCGIVVTAKSKRLVASAYPLVLILQISEQRSLERSSVFLLFILNKSFIDLDIVSRSIRS